MSPENMFKNKYTLKLEYILALCLQAKEHWGEELKKDLLLSQLFDELESLQDFTNDFTNDSVDDSTDDTTRGLTDQAHAHHLYGLTRLKGTLRNPDQLQHIMTPLKRELNKSDLDQQIDTNDKTLSPSTPFKISIVLENLRSAFNVGSIIRTAESFNLERVYLSGYTATPDSEKVLKSSMGAEKNIPWEPGPDTPELIRNLKAKGYEIVAIETAKNALSLEAFIPTHPTAVIFGNERFGISKETLTEADHIVRVPLYGKKNSLNVATCAGIVINTLVTKTIE